MAYTGTSVIVAALDPSDPRCRKARRLLEDGGYRVVSELTLVELASVVSRRAREENTSKVCARHGCEVVREAEGVGQVPLRARDARGLERGDEHPEKSWRRGAGARQSAQLHADAGRSHRAEEGARKQSGAR